MTNHIKDQENISNLSVRNLCTVLIFVFMILFLLPLLPGNGEVSAQDYMGERNADFLFKKPKNYFGFRAGIFSPEADSDLFKMITTELTLEKDDFRALDFGIDFGLSVQKRIDLVFSLDYSRRTKNSEFRNYVDNQGLAITQSTRFSQTPLTAGIKFLIVPRGRQVGQYSWIPSRIIPYVSGGMGMLWYEFSQQGDFVDYSTLEIFSATLKSSGGSSTVYLGCGTEFNIYKSVYVNWDFRYYWAEGDLDSDFVGFDPINLGGYRLTTGIQWHF